MNKEIEIRIHEIREILANLGKSDFDWRTAFSSSSGFPNGCCGDATDLIGLYLSKYYELESTYVCGKGLGNNPNQSHAWLLCQGYIIDITADQFNAKGYKLASVIIEKQSQFHDSFDTYKSHPFSANQLKDTGIPSVLAKVVSELHKSKVAL
ncbi:MULTISPECIES: hypothetical protein [Vibrio harveyi group]|uniref:hypothetical protein n=1 Tax=Vibrio harveyi group TaxID=717610 RepID=UPI00215F74AF|nr:hypothetical protein [Vibrio diabolicus]MCS0348088.1 hypothetical protein [Vibrio diabolicus]MCS0360690.1 hypothetical protein [Vibrio diabolicus]MCS0374967.1 hypothetical protein [Vibrio diabolicus]MCS0427249.1 hypothetical protein [Vibrio diabolicus]MCS0442743.1 hypothetical protein [Vibrio diabolicus]